MAKYYVRTFDCGEFSFYKTSETVPSYDLYNTSNEFLQYAWDGGSNFQIYCRQNMFLSYSVPGLNKNTYSVVSAYVPRNKTMDIHVTVQDTTSLPAMSDQSGTTHYMETSAITSHLDEWESYGWSNPDTSYSTFLNELCVFFDEAKVTDAASYGTDSGEINLYVITYIRGGTKYYFPLFRKGNDSNYDQIIEV